jgi:hypothetical protein
VGVVFEEGDSGLLEDDDRSVLEVVVVVVSFLPSPFVFLVLLDFIGSLTFQPCFGGVGYVLYF